MAAEVGACYLPSVERNEYGTPLVRSIFEETEERAKYDILCYVNADIILFEDFLPAVAEIARQFSRFLLVGRRTNLDVPTTLDFSPQWQERLRNRLRMEGTLEALDGLDYFVFPRDCGTPSHRLPLVGHCGTNGSFTVRVLRRSP